MDQPAHEKPTFLTRGFVGAASLNLFQSMGLMAVLPLIPLYLQSMGAGEFEIGLSGTAMFVSTMSFRLLAGRLADRVGRALPLIVGAALIVLGGAGYLLAAGPLWVTAARVLHGAGVGFFTTVTTAMVVDAVPPSRRAEALGIYGVSSNVASGVAPGLVLTLAATSGYTASFAVILAVGAACLVLSLLISRKPVQRRAVPVPVVPGGDPFTLRPLLVPLVTLVTFAVLYSIHFTFVPIVAAERGISGAGLYFAVYAVTVIVCRFVSGRLSDRFGPAWIIGPGIIIGAAGITVLALAQSLPGIAVSAILFAVGSGTVHPGILTQIFGLVPPHHRGSAAALFYIALDVGNALGGPLIGYLAERIGLQWGLLIGVAVSILGLVIYFLKPR